MPPDSPPPCPTAATLTARAELDRLWARGTAFLGCRFALMGGAMSWVSERHLVSAISNAGGFGVIACGSMNPDQLAAEIAGTQALTDKPFGVNLITMHPQLDDLVRVCLDGQGRPHRAGRRHPARRRGARGEGRRRQADRLHPGAGRWRNAWSAAAPTPWSSRARRPAAISARCR